MIHYSNRAYTLEGASFDPLDPAFGTGTGFSESIFYNGRQICHLERHLDRLLQSLRDYDIPYTAVNFDEVINQLLKRNGLVATTALIKIHYLLTKGAASPVITTEPMEYRPYKAYRLCVCDDRHISGLGSLRTSSTMFSHLALRRARSHGFDDVALFDLNNFLLESATGSLVLRKQGQFVCVNSPYRLNSVALNLAKNILDIVPVKISCQELESYHNAYICNSLIGMRPVVSIGEIAFIPDDESCSKVMSRILCMEG